jgi:hypothetical protein
LWSDLPHSPGAIGQTVNLYWDLENIISAFNQSGFKAYEQELSVNVTVNIPNSLGTARNSDVSITVNPAVMTGITFEDKLLGNGKPVDDSLSTLSSASGVSWNNAARKLVINPMRVRSLTEAVLPSSVTMITAQGQFTFSGLKWEFLPLTIENSGGVYANFLKLTIGDEIGGYQHTEVTVEVAAININDFEILNDAATELTTDDIENETLYKHYVIANPYNYEMPVKTKVFTTQGEFILVTNWSFPTFSPATLFNGGEYEGTYQAGSQLLKVRISVSPTISVMENGLSFRPEDTAIHFDADKGLVFNPYTSEDFTNALIYPATGLATFTDGEGNNRQLVVPLRWDISAITALYASGNPDMYLGKSVIVKAYTDYANCGSQQFNVDIYIEEAIIDANQVVFSLGNPTKTFALSIFGEDAGKLTLLTRGCQIAIQMR